MAHEEIYQPTPGSGRVSVMIDDDKGKKTVGDAIADAVEIAKEKVTEAFEDTGRSFHRLGERLEHVLGMDDPEVVREKGDKIGNSAPHEKFNTGQYLVENRGGEITLFAKKSDIFKEELKGKARELKAEARVKQLFEDEGIPLVTPEFKRELKEHAIPDTGPSSPEFWADVGMEKKKKRSHLPKTKEVTDWQKATAEHPILVTPEFKTELRNKAKESKWIHENQGHLTDEFKEELARKSFEIRHQYREHEEMRHGLSKDFKKELKHVAHKKHKVNRRRDFTELEQTVLVSPLKEEHGEKKKHHHHHHHHHGHRKHSGDSGKKEILEGGMERTA